MKQSLFAIFIMFLFAYPYAAQADGDKLFNAKSITLDNGLEVIAIPNPRAPVITQMVWYKVGAADEPLGVSGIAHYLEHLMFKGSQNVPSGEFSKTIRALGGNDNAFTAQDYTAYFQNIASTYLEKAMEMEADRMNGLQISLEDAKHELDVVFEERAKRLENNPAAQLSVQIDAALFPEHPYSTPVIGWRQDLEKFNLNKVLRFYDKFYAPNNARLIVAGDITMEELEPLAKKYYGAVKKKEDVERLVTFAKIEPLNATSTIVLKDKLVKQPVYVRSYRAPAWVNGKETALALSIFQEMVAGGADAPLYQDLVVDKKVASSITLDYEIFTLGPSEITFSAYPKEGVSLDEVARAIDAFVEKYSDFLWSEKQLENAVTKIQDRSVFSRDSVSGPAFIVGRAMASGVALEDLEIYPQLYEQVSLDQLKKTVKQWFSPAHNYVEGRLLPAPKQVDSKPEKEKQKEDEDA